MSMSCFMSKGIAVAGLRAGSTSELNACIPGIFAASFASAASRWPGGSARAFARSSANPA
jgi:hypothetical protein